MGIWENDQKTSTINSMCKDISKLEHQIADLQATNDVLRETLKRHINVAKKHWLAACLNLDCDITDCGKCYGCKAQALGYLIHNIESSLFTTPTNIPRWTLLPNTSPSGKMLFQCKYCGRITTTPDKTCNNACETKEGTNEA